MSNSYYTNLWKETQNELRTNINYDRIVKKKGPIKDPDTAKWVIGRLFLGYVRIVNKLDQCYDQVIHPQKKEVIGRLLDCSLGRLLEIKRDIIKIELDDYVFFDNILFELKLTPEDVQIRIPEYFWREREKSRAHRRELIKRVYEELEEEKYKHEYLEKFPEEEREEMWAKYLSEKEAERIEAEKMEELQRRRMEAAVQESDAKQIQEQPEYKTPQEITEAVLLIQRHERARQGRRNLLTHKRMNTMRNMGLKEPKLSEGTANEAATVIEQHWRRQRKRVLAKRKLEKEMLILGMILPSWRDLTIFQKLEQVMSFRRDMQDRNQQEYENALEMIKEKMTKLYSASMSEDITDEIRYWFEWFFKNTDYLPDYPGEELTVPTGEILGIPKIIGKDFIEKNFPQKKKQMQEPLPKTKIGLELSGITPIGGSALVTAEHWISPKEFLICQKEVERLKKSGGGGGNKTEKKKMSKEEKAALKKKEKEAEKRRLEAEAAAGFQLSDSNFQAPLAKADKDYRDYWLDLDESQNYEQKHICNLIKDEKLWELSMQVRQTVDEAMRLELEILKEALERDRNPKKKKKKPNKSKKKKAKGKKRKKDPTADRTNDELFIELFKNGIIREYDEAYLKDFIGERSYSAYEHRQKLEDGQPSIGDVRETLLQLCILPLGSSRVHKLSPVIRSVCLLGPEHCGKEFLARIVCTETASIMFDLTPENTAGKYTSKSDMKMLLHLVEKMSRVFQPAVIFVDGAEKLFYKKVPKEEKKYDPKRLGPMLTKLVKGIKEDDQVLVLGVSSYPWLCPKPKLAKTYNKFIYVPQPDYGTYYVLWQKLLTPYHSVSRDFDFSCLAKISKGYSMKAIMDTVKNVATPEKIARCRIDPYKPSDFAQELCKMEPIQDKLLAKFIAFYDKTDARKKRLRKIQEIKMSREKSKKK